MEKLPVSNTSAHSLREEQMPILRRERGHEDPQEFHKRADDEGQLEESCIRRAA